jgi:hypothetical protein
VATLIPSLGTASFDTRGELRLAERLKEFLEDNSFIWHNLPVGPRGGHPDFVIVHPAKGLLVLDVKDWRRHDRVRRHVGRGARDPARCDSRDGSFRTSASLQFRCE